MPDAAPGLPARVERGRRATREVVREWLLPSRTLRRRPWPPLAGVAYVAVIALLGGLRADHVLLGMLGLLDLYNERTRSFLRVFFPFILTGAIFDSMRYFYWQGVAGHVHVSEPYLLEQRWFGVGGRTPNEIFLEHHWAALDLACGLAYLVFVGEYLALAFYLFGRGRLDRAATFARCFLLVDLLGFLTYFVYPAAPPWYVTAHGLGPARLDVAPASAAAQRFDALVGLPVFERMYGHGIDVYGAFPSLHVAYPLMAAILAFRVAELRWARWPAALFFVLMCFSAVYLQHHYVVDVVLGVVYALITLAAVATWERPRRAPGA